MGLDWKRGPRLNQEYRPLARTTSAGWWLREINTGSQPTATVTSYPSRKGTHADVTNVARGSEARNGQPLGSIIARAAQEPGPAFTSPPFDMSAEQFRNNHITLTPPHNSISSKGPTYRQVNQFSKCQ